MTPAHILRCRENLDAVRGRVAEACRKGGRDPSSVRIVGVTKYVSSDSAAILLELGCLDLAESRPQSLWEKSAAMAKANPPPRWHFVGHLQRNKVRRTIGVTSLIHSLDSQRLLEAIDAEAAVCGRVCEMLVEVNLSGDRGRTGVSEQAVGPLVEAAAQYSHVRVCGLMGMASEPEGADAQAQARRQFAHLRQIRERLVASSPAAAGLNELSMGMSGDFEEAVLEGATLVRIGSALWEGIAAHD